MAKLLAAVLSLATLLLVTAPAQADPEASDPMTVDRLMERPIPAVCNFPAARYVDGVHPDSPGPDFTFAEVVGATSDTGDVPLQAKVGDVTGDGVDDGLLDVVCTYGGNTLIFNLFVYRSDGPRLGRVPVERYASSFIWPPVYPRANIRNGQVNVTVESWRDGDPHCCPSKHKTLHFRWTGLRFVKV